MGNPAGDRFLTGRPTIDTVLRSLLFEHAAGAAGMAARSGRPAAGRRRVTRTKPYQLLIADDDDSFRDVLRSIFEPWFSLVEAHSGEEAVQIVGGRRIDLILLDLHMDHLSGIDTIRIVKRIDQRLPCILVTSDFTETVRQEALEARAWSVLEKPVRKQVLLETVSTAIDSTYGDPDVFSVHSDLN